MAKGHCRIPSVLSKDHTEMLVHAVITSRLDNCNSLSINTSKTNRYKLEKFQNTAARLVVRDKKMTPITQPLKDLHWLKAGNFYRWRCNNLTSS